MSLPAPNPSATAADLPAKTLLSAEKIVTANTETMTASTEVAGTALQELTKAYQELAARNAKNLTDAIHALSAVKSPAEFIELQQKLIKDGVQAAVSDSQNIAHLTAAVFSAAFEPVKKQVEAMHRTAVH
jgi:hypothetical protein